MNGHYLLLLSLYSSHSNILIIHSRTKELVAYLQSSEPWETSVKTYFCINNNSIAFPMHVLRTRLSQGMVTCIGSSGSRKVGYSSFHRRRLVEFTKCSLHTLELLFSRRFFLPILCIQTSDVRYSWYTVSVSKCCVVTIRYSITLQLVFIINQKF